MKIATKIGHFSNTEYINHLAPHTDYFEMYVATDFKYQSLKFPNKEIVIHAAHQGEGVNFADPSKESLNKKAIGKAIAAANYYGSTKIIFHPGWLENKLCSFDYSVNFIVENYDARLCVENMPITSDEKRFVCTSPDEVRQFIKKAKVGFCLDYAHACEANEYLQNQNFLKDFLALNPRIFHLNDTDLDEIKRPKPQKESHLPLNEGNLNLDVFIRSLSPNSYLTLETPLIAKRQIQEIETIRQNS